MAPVSAHPSGWIELRKIGIASPMPGQQTLKTSDVSPKEETT
jgi:hypothetical protein